MKWGSRSGGGGQVPAVKGPSLRRTGRVPDERKQVPEAELGDGVDPRGRGSEVGLSSRRRGGGCEHGGWRWPGTQAQPGSCPAEPRLAGTRSRDPGRSGWGFSPPLACSLAPAPARGPRAARLLPSPSSPSVLPEVVHGGARGRQEPARRRARCASRSRSSPPHWLSAASLGQERNAPPPPRAPRPPRPPPRARARPAALRPWGPPRRLPAAPRARWPRPPPPARRHAQPGRLAPLGWAAAPPLVAKPAGGRLPGFRSSVSLSVLHGHA